MPELPEVETVVRGLEAALRGRRIESVRLGKTDFIEDPFVLEQKLPGSRIAGVRRYGKFVIFELERASGDLTGEKAKDARLYFLIHLGMTGQLTAGRPEQPVAQHTHARFGLDDGAELRYTDIRRFGRMLVVPESRRETVLGSLGIDPLEATPEELAGLLAGRRARVKALLLDQHFLRGLGNIYTDESLWRARIHPGRPAASLRREEALRLHRAIQGVLREAIRLRGSSVSDYVDAEGNPGEFQRRHRVYQREGKKCFHCGARIGRIVVAGRSSYFCPRCQRAPRRRPKRRASQRQR